MASPFSVFRKNQKVMIAVLGVLAMFAFVFLPIIMEQMGIRTVRNPVVVKTSKYGNLHGSDVEALRRQRQKVLGVLTEAIQTNYPTLPPAIIRQWLEARIGPATEEAVVNGWLLARYAEQMGVVISDKTIIAFLKKQTTGAANPDQLFHAAFKRLGITEIQFLSAMRDELAVLQLDSMFRVSLMGVTPAQRWEYFKRVKQMATIEAVPVAVANYLDRVGKPSDEELIAFFEEAKERYPLPGSPEPGFREPQKVALEYFKADYEKFAAPNMVTDEEIQAHYEKNKDLYDQPAQKPEERKPRRKRKKSHPPRTRRRQRRRAGTPRSRRSRTRRKNQRIRRLRAVGRRLCSPRCCRRRSRPTMPRRPRGKQHPPNNQTLHRKQRSPPISRKHRWPRT